MDGRPLPRNAEQGAGRGGVFTIHRTGSQFGGLSSSLRTLYRDGWIITRYDASSIYDGTEGELYDLKNDPLQWRNLWDEPAMAAIKVDLLDDLRTRTPPLRTPRVVPYSSVWPAPQAIPISLCICRLRRQLGWARQ